MANRGSTTRRWMSRASSMTTSLLAYYDLAEEGYPPEHPSNYGDGDEDDALIEYAMGDDTHGHPDNDDDDATVHRSASTATGDERRRGGVLARR